MGKWWRIWFRNGGYTAVPDNDIVEYLSINKEKIKSIEYFIQ